MRFDDRAWAGVFGFAAAAQFLTLMMVAEALAPTYHVGENAISDLGVGATANLFNASVIALGLLTFVGASLLHRVERDWFVTVPFFLLAIGAVGVGLFPETTGAPHGIAALVAFVFANLEAILAYRIERPPLRLISPILGVVGLAALALSVSGTYLGLGFGGMERMVVYPPLIWALAFNGSLMTSPATTAAMAANP